MRFTNVITTGVEPKVGIPISCTVLFAVIQHALKNIGNCAVVATTVTCGQDYDVAVARVACIAIPPSIVRHLPVPFGLCLEVPRLRLVIL